MTDYFQSALAAHRAGRLVEAERGYKKTLSREKRHADALHLLGLVQHQKGDLPLAERLIRQSLAQREEAVVLGNLGVLLRKTGRLPEAETLYRRAIALKPDYAEAYNNLGNLLQDIGRLPEAETLYRHAIALKPDYAEASLNLGGLLHNNLRLIEAEAIYRHVLALKPDDTGTFRKLGDLLQDTGRLAEAEGLYRHAIALRPDDAQSHNSLGILLRGTGRLPEAEATNRRALDIQPDDVEARVNLGFTLLTLGRYGEAWPYHEGRYAKRLEKAFKRLPDLPYPQWRGEPLAGKSLVIWPEQGFGDAIQFVRYVPWLKACGLRRLTLVCIPILASLLKTVEGVDAVVTDTAALPQHDYWCLPLSLPLHKGTTLDSIPAALPYLHALPAALEHWRARLPEGGLKVGLVWKGSSTHVNDAHRSLPGIATLTPLWSLPGVSFVSLQKGQGEEEARQWAVDRRLIHLGSDLRDFADTAALITQLDLVICVDTAVAHLAGALGKPCWVLLPAFRLDWRWLLNRPDSPWYPKIMRLFRQSRLDDWRATIDAVAHALAHVLTIMRSADASFSSTQAIEFTNSLRWEEDRAL